MPPNYDCERNNWGTAGFADAERWPFLPKGLLSAGQPIPHGDARHISLLAQSIVPPIDGFPKDVNLFALNDVPSHEKGTIFDDIDFALSLDEKAEGGLTPAETTCRLGGCGNAADRTNRNDTTSCSDKLRAAPPLSTETSATPLPI
jgi:hypothetical protein